MINVGIAGVGFMGTTHFKAWAEVPGARVAALCTRSEKKLAGDWSDVQGNFGDAGGVQDLSGIATYREFADLIADPGLDLLDLCLPTRLHPDCAIAALEAGKHVLVEKPIAIEVADADRMIAAARAAGRQLLVAQVLRFWPEWRWLKEQVDGGAYGRLVTLNLRRIISMPDWSRDVADMAANGGPMIDLHIHDVDFMLYLLGRPRRVISLGQHRQGLVSFISTLYDYDGVTVSCQSGAASMKGRMFCHEFEACFERATAVLKFSTEPDTVDPAAHQSGTQVLTVYLPDGTVGFPQPGGGEAFAAQLSHVAECLASGAASPLISGESARDSLAVTHLEAQSALTGRAVEVA